MVDELVTYAPDGLLDQLLRRATACGAYKPKPIVSRLSTSLPQDLIRIFSFMDTFSLVISIHPLHTLVSII
jgi:hypothetical protein